MNRTQTNYAPADDMADPDFVPRFETFRAPLPARIWLRRPILPQPSVGRWSRLAQLLGDIFAFIGAAVMAAALFFVLVFVGLII